MTGIQRYRAERRGEFGWRIWIQRCIRRDEEHVCTWVSCTVTDVAILGHVSGSAEFGWRASSNHSGRSRARKSHATAQEAATAYWRNKRVGYAIRTAELREKEAA